MLALITLELKLKPPALSMPSHSCSTTGPPSAAGLNSRVLARSSLPVIMSRSSPLGSGLTLLP